jgi:hypothetical protein
MKPSAASRSLKEIIPGRPPEPTGAGPTGIN